MIYVHKVGSVYHKEGEVLDVKAAWKAVAPKMIRRTDRFIQLALLGAHKAVGELTLSKNCAIYMASGQGNLAVFKRLRDQRYIHKQPPKPVDFINSLSNTSGFYVAQFFGITGKNLNVSRLGFVAETTLLLAQNDLELGREEEILLGGVDELQTPVDFTRRTLGLCDERQLGEGSNWMLLSAHKDSALASLDVEKKMLDFDTLLHYISIHQGSGYIAFGQRIDSDERESILQKTSTQRELFEATDGFYETASLQLLNDFIEKAWGNLLFIERYKDKYRVIKVDTF